MGQRTLFSFLLLALVLILALFVVLSDGPGQETADIILDNFNASGVTHITVRNQDGILMEFGKQDSQWFITSPLRARARQTRVDAILRLPGSKSITRIESHNSPAGVFGLDPPRLTIHLDDQAIYLGDTDPIDGHRYVMTGETIHLVGDGLIHQLLQGPMFYISGRLVPEDETIETIRLDDRLVNTSGDRPLLTPADSGIETVRLERLVEAWQTGEAHQVRQYPPGDARKKIVLGFKNGRSARFDVISTGPGLVLGRADLNLQYHIDGELASRLLLTGPGKEEN